VIKTFVLDTNILLLDPLCIFKFDNNNINIPLVCIEELDRFKRDQGENGRNSRHFCRILDKMRKSGSLFDGVKLDNGGILSISDNRSIADVGVGLIHSKNDNIILGTALKLKEKDKNIILVTKDVNLRIKADVLKLQAEDYGKKSQLLETMYSGQGKLHIESKRLEVFMKGGFLSLTPEEEEDLYANQYLTIFDPADKGCQLFGRYNKKMKGIVPISNFSEGVWGIYPKNIEQRFALDALLDNEIKMVTLVGQAGTGKTLLAIAAALEKTIEKGDFIRTLVSRPIQPMGKDLGYLPGDIEDKIGPWMLPIFDALDFLFGKQKYKGSMPHAWSALKEKGLIQVEPLTYIRGRSIPSQFFIIDEAQNLSPHEVKTIITRVAEGSKIILAGDCEQIDNPYLDSMNNGLNYAVERLKGENIVAHINLRSGERSQLSEIASKLL
jgi:PhoH-like ATPase